MIRKLVITTIWLFTFSSYSVEIEHKGATFNISDTIKTQNEELIALILNTESMDDNERQYWFDILPSMTDEQVNRLFYILDTERTKLKALEEKYATEIKELNEKHLIEWRDFQRDDAAKNILDRRSKSANLATANKYIAFNEKMLPRVSISPIEEANIKSLYIPSENDNLSRYEHMIMLEFGQILIENPDKYTQLYGEELFSGYRDSVLASAIELNDTKTLSLLLTKKLIDRESVNTAMYMARSDFSSLAKQYQAELETPQWSNWLISKLINLTMWRKDESCIDVCDAVLKAFFNKIEAENYPFKYENITGYFEAHLIVYDLISYMNKDIMNDTLRAKFAAFIEKYVSVTASYSQRNQNWYSKLTHAYFSGKMLNLYDSVLEEFKQETDHNSLEGDLLEVSTYLAFELIKNNREEQALQLLVNSKSFGDSIYSSAYKYLEKDMVDYLIKVALEPNKYKKGIKLMGTYTVQDGKKSFTPFGKKYAIIVGVSDYEQLVDSSSNNEVEFVDLKYADADAHQFKKFLLDPEHSGGGWEIHTFINEHAKSLEIRKTIDSVLTNANENDLIYLFFSGHGRLNPNNDSEVYLLPYDFNPHDPYSGIPYDWLISTVNRTAAKHLVAFIDACRSGTIKNAKGNMFVDQALLSEVLSHSKTKVVFTSGSGSQISYEDDNFKQGIFSHFLLKGLYGESDDLNKDGYVNLNELEEYTSHAVSHYTSDIRGVTYQKPRVSNLDATFSVQFPLSIR